MKKKNDDFQTGQKTNDEFFFIHTKLNTQT